MELQKQLRLKVSIFLHDVRDDADAPEVRVEGEGLVVDHLRGHKLRRTQHLPHLAI